MYYIALKKHFPQIDHEFITQSDYFKKQGFMFEINTFVEGKWVCFQCQLKGLIEKKENLGELILRKYLAEILTSYMLNELIYCLINQFIEKHYHYFCETDKEKIFQYAKKRLSKDLIEDHVIKAEIRNQFLNYLSHCNYINIEGFINFRMKDFTKRLEEIVDGSVDDLLSDKEYKEFIRLLKHFVSLQKPKIELIHVTVNEDKKLFEFRDCCYKLINPVRIEDFSVEAFENELDCEDMLISTLITLAPQKIIVHKNVFSTYPQALETLQYIFENRVKTCFNCKLCNLNIILKDK